MLEINFEVPTVVPNELLSDLSLSNSAKGFYATMLYFIENKGVVSKEYAKKNENDFFELLENGYITKDKDGKFNLALPE